MKKFYNKKSSSAITLVALVITILVILILAGVGLNLVIDDSGIIKRTDSVAQSHNYNFTFEQLQSILLAAKADDIRHEPTLKSIVKYLLNDSENEYIISSASRADDLENVGDIQNENDVNGKTEVYIIFNNFEFRLDDDLNLHKIDIQIAQVDNNTTNTTNTSTDNQTHQSSNIGNYVSDGLILHYDGIQNTRSGNNPNATVWEDLTENHNDGILNGFNTSTGFYSSAENGYVLLGHNSYIESTNNLGLTGDAPYTIEIVCTPWSDEKANMTGPNEYLALWDYGTIYNELEDQKHNTFVNLERENGNIKTNFVNMWTTYSNNDELNNKITSLQFRKTTGQIGTSDTSVITLFKDNTPLTGLFNYDSTWR